MHIVVDVGQGRVDTPERGGNNAVDHNQLFHGDDRVDTLALDLADRHDLFTTIHGLHTITHSHGRSGNHWQRDRASTGTGRQDMVEGHLDITTVLRGEESKGSSLLIGTVGKVYHIGEHLFTLVVDGQHTVTHLDLRDCLGETRFHGHLFGPSEAGAANAGGGGGGGGDGEGLVDCEQLSTGTSGGAQGDEASADAEITVCGGGGGGGGGGGEGG